MRLFLISTRILCIQYDFAHFFLLCHYPSFNSCRSIATKSKKKHQTFWQMINSIGNVTNARSLSLFMNVCLSYGISCLLCTQKKHKRHRKAQERQRNREQMSKWNTQIKAQLGFYATLELITNIYLLYGINSNMRVNRSVRREWVKERERPLLTLAYHHSPRKTVA